jgi:predicted unusual protein kinase regulating ubiquinone biosynthesis (AarF/ABC1/UbiB family)
VNRSRYRRIIFFFARVILSVIFWDIILRRIGFRKTVSRTRPSRLRRIAKDYHDMAVQMGGVLIKMGQFLSARADVLPEEITSELSGLQDEVPPEDFNHIRKLAEAELGAPLDEKYDGFNEEPLAAASLGQVHRARLQVSHAETSPDWIDVVVKIQRPDIEMIIATDLAALRTVSNWLMRYKPISRRADIPALLSEFSRVLYEEIDYLAEGRNAETFAENFKDTPGVQVPGVLWTHTTKRVLTLEDVYAIKVTDYDQITAAGVPRPEVAKRLFDIYLKQIFEDGFFHADPHAGNLFVNPNSAGEEGWQLTFVDFGMVGRVTPSVRAGIRELVIGVGTKDAARMVNSYQMLNMLLPYADLELITQAEAKVFDRFWGKSMEELREIPLDEMHEFAKEYRELAYAMPFQLPQDLIFLLRTIAILSGMCTGLDPKFNVWESITPYAGKLLAEEDGSSWDFLVKEVAAIFQSLIALPRQLETALGKIERDELGVRAPMIELQVGKLELTMRRIVFALIFLALLTSGVQLHLGGEIIFARVLYGGAVVSLVAMILAKPSQR